MQEHLLGIDTGGTFTDFAYLHNHQLITHKRLSTPDAPEQAIFEGLAALGLDALCAAGQLTIIHGTTVATNAALEGRGAKTAYVCNQGLGDILSIGRQNRADLYSLAPTKKTLSLDQGAIYELPVRRNAKGDLITVLDEAAIDALEAALAEDPPAALAINLLFSFINDTEEQVLKARFGHQYFVSLSSQVLPEMGEYERGVATYLNAALGPIIARYLDQLQAKIAPSRLTVMQSSGLTLAAEHAAEHAVRLLLSGPAGGLIAARSLLASEQLMTFDMGGTSTDVSLIHRDLAISKNMHLNGLPIAIPAIDIQTIGAGGGSIAEIDAGGLLKVGPRSAGARPGPACYNLGGTTATVTDANVVLGRLPVTQPLADNLWLDAEQAHRAVEKLATRLNLTPIETAQGIVTLANEAMAEALRLISIQKGFDPSAFTLCCFGGAGGLHLCELAERLGMHQALVPADAGIFSALGMLAATPGRELTRAVNLRANDCDPEDIRNRLDDLIHVARTALAAEGIDDTTVHPVFELRYHGQTQTLSVPYLDDLQAAFIAFETQHEIRYGHQLDTGIELVALRVRVAGIARLKTPLTPTPNATSTDRAPQTNPNATPQQSWKNLIPGQAHAGPMIITAEHTCVWVKPEWTLKKLTTGHLQLSRKGLS